MARPLASLRRRVRPANLYHYTHKLESWNKLDELVIFGKLGELEDFTKLVMTSKLEQRKDPAYKDGSYLGVSI